jgi:ABC-2 type transport system permease protein
MVIMNHGFLGPNYAPSTAAHRANYIYFLYQLGLTPLILGTIIGNAIASALLAFGFLYRKNAVNVFFSLGMSRKKLFQSRYLAGMTMTVLPPVLVLVTSFILNIILFGSSAQLLSAFTYLLLGYTILAVLAFTIAAVMCILCGTVTEALFLSAYGLGGISLLLLGLNNLMGVFLHGSPYGHTSSYYFSVGENLVQRLSAINPVLFFFGAGRFLAMKGSEVSGIVPPPVELQPVVLIGWLVIAIILAYTAMKLFELRKAEIAGITGTNRGVGFVCTFIPTFFFFSLALRFGEPVFRMPLAFNVAAIAGIIVYILSEVVFRQFPFRSNLLKLPMVIGIIVLCVVILVSGGFGFANRLPAAGEIESVYISYKGSPDYQHSFASGSSGGGSYVFTLHDFAYSAPEDIAKVLDVHRGITEYGKQPLSREAAVDDPSGYTLQNEIKISYSLKNGGEFNRYYNATSVSNLIKLLYLDDTKQVRSVVDAHFQEENTRSVISYGEIYLADLFFADEFHYQPEAQVRSALVDALRSDITSQLIEQRYFPEKPAIGVIIFADASVKTDMNYFGDPGLYGTNYWNLSRIYISEDFTRTIAFLQEENLLEHFIFKGEIDYLTVERYVINPPDSRYYYMEKSHYFRSFKTDYYQLPNPEKVTDPAKQSELLSLIRTNYFAAEGGYVIGVHVKGKGPTYFFLPGEDALEYLKSM